jgi:hypothetical protein
VPVAVWVPVPFVATALFGAFGPLIGRRLAPRCATWLLSVGSLLMTASGAIVLALKVFSAIGAVPIALRGRPPGGRPALEAILVVLALAAMGTPLLAAHDIGEMFQAAILHVHPPAVAGIS